MKTSALDSPQALMPSSSHRGAVAGASTIQSRPVPPRRACAGWRRCPPAPHSPHDVRLGWLQRCRAEGSGQSSTGDEGESTRELALGDVVDVLQQQGIQFVFDDEEDDEWDDILEDLDDPWMREPSPALEIDSASTLPPLTSTEPPAAPVSAYSPEAGFVETTAEELREALDSLETAKPLVLDVRSSVEFSVGHIDGSVHTPLQSLTKEAVESYQPGTPIVVVGSGDHRSQQAAVRLKRVFGFADVKHFTGGLPEWKSKTSSDAC